MKKLYHAFYGRPGIALLLLLTLFIIHSCRKSTKQDDVPSSTPLTVDVNKFKTIYNAGINTPLVTKAAQPGQAVLNLVQSLNVDWTSYIATRRADSSVVNEFEMVPDSSMFTFKDSKIGDTIKYRNKTSVVFIQSAKKNLNFFMKVIEDLTVPGTTKTLIGYFHYGYVPAGFNGEVLYYTLDRTYMGGYRYVNGRVNASISIAPAKSNTQLQIQSSGKKVNVAQLCQEYDVYGSWCGRNGYRGDDGQIIWTYFYCVEEYLGTFTACDDIPSGGGDPGTGGGGAPGDNNDPCGGGGGGGGSTVYVASKLKIQQVAPGDGDPCNPTPPPPPPPDITKTPCDELETVILPMVTSTAGSAQDATIAGKLTTDPSHEWGVEHRATNFTSGSLMPISPTQGNATTWPAPPFHWDSVNGYTIGYSHNHPDAGPDVDDLSVGLGYYYNNMYTKPAADQDFFKTNFSITTITNFGTYITSVRDWDALANIITGTYGNDINRMDADWRTYAQAYLNNNTGANDGDAAAYAMMQIFGNSIYTFYKAPGQSTYQPLRSTYYSNAVTVDPCN